jgi:hypothetical protein
MTTDGREVFVAESSAPSVWAIDVHGGTVIPFDTGLSPHFSIGTPLFAWHGGLYFDTWRDDAYPLRWASDDGTTLKSVATENMLAFDPSGSRGFRSVGVDFFVESISFLDGTRTPIIPTGGATLAQMVTSARFLHAIAVSDTVIDRRMEFSSGVITDVPITGFTAIVSAGRGVCFADSTSVSCLSDDDDAPTSFAAKVDEVSSADADWVYVNVNHRLSRASRVDGHVETILDAEAKASVPFGACLYAITAEGSTMALWRLAP